MCVSIIVGITSKASPLSDTANKIGELAQKYEYGLLTGLDQIRPSDREPVAETLTGSSLIFQIHDLPEAFCACDIEEDIRIGSKLGKTSKFFDFISEVMESGDVKAMAVLFYSDIKPETDNIRHHMGGQAEFIELLNKWHTWQVEGFEPTREAYFIADESPLLYTFTQLEQVH